MKYTNRHIRKYNSVHLRASNMLWRQEHQESKSRLNCYSHYINIFTEDNATKVLHKLAGSPAEKLAARYNIFGAVEFCRYC